VLARWRAAGVIGPALMTALMLPVLIGLGTWQWHRKQWKEDLIAKIAARVKAEPVSYTEALREYWKTGDVEYLRVRVSGTFDYASERHLFAPRVESQGWDVYTRFAPDGDQPLLLVNRGWVPDRLKDPASRTEGQISGHQTLVGLIRLDQSKGFFTPPNDPRSNRWFSRDSGAMFGDNDRDFSENKLTLVHAPFSLDAEAEPANPGGWPRGGTTEINIPNRHLEYVLTWYGFAVTLAIIFTLYVRQRLAALDAAAATADK